MNDINTSIIASTEQELSDRIKALPISLSVKDVAGFLGVCLATAYTIVGKPEFPKKHIKGVRRYVIPKTKFIEWYLDINENQD